MLCKNRVTELSSHQICREREIYSFASAPPRINLHRMLKTHGYREPDRVPKKVIAEALRARANAERYAQPQSFYRFLDIHNLSEGQLGLKDGPKLVCPAFDLHLRGCTRVCLFVTTLGERLDQEISDCMDETFFEPLEALFLGTFGWLMVEAATRDLMWMLKTDMARKGRSLTMRMGPGYSYRLPDVDERVSWTLTDQAPLLSVFEDVDLPIELTSGFSMKPSMTRSGLAGLKTGIADARPDIDADD